MRASVRVGCGSDTCDERSLRWEAMGKIFVSWWRCAVFVSNEQPVIVLSALF